MADLNNVVYSLQCCRRLWFVCDARPALCHPMVLIKCAGFVFRLSSCLENVVEHHCPYTRQCVLVLGLHTDEQYSSFDRISKFYVVS